MGEELCHENENINSSGKGFNIRALNRSKLEIHTRVADHILDS